jgi:hypothetical protein
LTQRLVLLMAVAAALVGCAELRARFPGPDVVFIATPADVSLEMLRMASVTPGDVVFDLGSGDGRVVVAAARDFGARAFGVELDPELVKQSRDAAAAAGVAERATFLWQDLFATDLREARVVTLYLRDDVNLRLRPKLLRELTPGSRVVSHDFDMGDWPADRVQKVRGPTRNHTLYLWLIPADVAGVWRLRIGEREALLNLTQRYQVLGGTLTVDAQELPVTRGRLAGDRIELRTSAGVLSGRVAGDTIEGPVEGTPATWRATRVR